MFSKSHIAQSLKENDRLTENNDLVKRAIEEGSLVGLHSLPPDDFPRIVEAELQVLSERRFGPLGPSPAVLIENGKQFEEELQEAQGKINAYLSQSDVRSARPEMECDEGFSTTWRQALSIATLVALVGLVLEMCRISLGLKGIAMLALVSVLLILNWNALPSLARNRLSSIRGYVQYRRAVSKAGKLSRRISELNHRRMVEVERRSMAEEWAAREKDVVLGHYQYHRSKGEVAARQPEQGFVKAAASFNEKAA